MGETNEDGTWHYVIEIHDFDVWCCLLLKLVMFLFVISNIQLYFVNQFNIHKFYFSSTIVLTISFFEILF